MGQTGRVVSLKALDGKPTAVILTDGVNTELLCDVNNLQVIYLYILSENSCGICKYLMKFCIKLNPLVLIFSYFFLFY